MKGPSHQVCVRDAHSLPLMGGGRSKQKEGKERRKKNRNVPEQLRQTKTPRLTLAQVGPLPPHSAQRRLASSFRRAARARRWASAWARVTEDLSAIDFTFFFKWRVEVEVEKEIDGGRRDGKKKEVDDGGEREKNRGRFWGGRALCSFPFQ